MTPPRISSIAATSLHLPGYNGPLREFISSPFRRCILLFEGAFPFCVGPNSRASSLETAPTAARAPRIELARCLPNRRRAIAFCNVAANIGIQLNDGDKPKYCPDLLCQRLGQSVSGLAFDEGMTLSAARRWHA